MAARCDNGCSRYDLRKELLLQSPGHSHMGQKASVCTIIEIGVPFDTNVAVRQAEKGNKYMPLVSELQQMYPSFKYQIIPIIIGALGAVPKKLKEHLLKLNIKENRIKTTTKKLQKAAILGSVRIMKTFMNM